MVMKSIKISKKELKELYEKQKLTTYEIADIYNCCQATIWKRLVKYRIKRLPNGRQSVVISKPELKRLYVNQHLSSRKIAKLYNCAYSTIDIKIRRYGFPVKTLAGAHIIYPRKDFDGRGMDKAYLMGFAIGDLRVRKIYPNSETIHVDCGSTRKEQINLITKLFKPYGRVWISGPNKKGATQIECSINESFSFLLEKRDKIDKWILEDNNYFIAFLAGFTDAEGSIFINSGTACYSLGNYNATILFQIRNKLVQMGIECPTVRKDNTKGYIDKDGYIRNQDYFQLSIHRKFYLLELFKLIYPYLRHARKIEDTRKAIKSIQWRNKHYGNINMEI